MIRKKKDMGYDRARKAGGVSDWGSDSDEMGGGTRWMRGIDLADAREREEQGRCLPSTYRRLLGEAPSVSNGDVGAAKRYLHRIQAAIDEGGWSSSESARLYRLRDKWRERAEGVSARYEVAGNRVGGLEKEKQSRVHDQKLVREMVRRLSRSFGNGD